MALSLRHCPVFMSVELTNCEFRRYWPIELAVAEKTLFALVPINRIVPTTSTRMTASTTAYSAMSWPSSCDQSLRRKSAIFAPLDFNLLSIRGHVIQERPR
jgi:hypothetical protein